MKKTNKTIYILTAFGAEIDSILEIHKTYESARDSIRDYVEDANAYEEIVCSDIWKTESASDGVIEWQIWKEKIPV